MGMKKLIIIIFIILFCFGCTKKQEVLPVVSDIDFKVYYEEQDCCSFDEFDNLVITSNHVLEYIFTLEPYEMIRDPNFDISIMLWENVNLKNDFFKRNMGIGFTGNHYREKEIPMQSKEPLQVSICVDFNTDIPLDVIEAYAQTINEVKYSIRVDGFGVVINTFSLK